MISAFWHAIGWHLGTWVFHLGPFLLLALALAWFRHSLRRLRRSTHRNRPGGSR